MLKGYEAYNTINILGRAINERALKITRWGVLMGRGAIKLHFLIERCSLSYSAAIRLFFNHN